MADEPHPTTILNEAVSVLRRSTAPKLESPEQEFGKLRAHVRGTLIYAKHHLSPNQPWTMADDQILDTVTLWLEQQR